MTIRYWLPIAALTAGLVSVVYAVAVSSIGTEPLVVASAAAPLAALGFVAIRIGRWPRPISVIGGATIGPAFAVVGGGVVFGIVFAFFSDTLFQAADFVAALVSESTGSSLVGELTAPSAMFLIAEVAIVVPATEEIGKVVGAGVWRSTTRQEAFIAGVGAGVGFAIVENLLYATQSSILGPSGEAVATLRMIGVAVHPLATAMVALGWWEWRRHRDLRSSVAHGLSGIGIHGLWNGSLAVLILVGDSYGVVGLGDFGIMTISCMTALGIIAAGGLWALTHSVASDEKASAAITATDGRVLAGWIVLATVFLIPVMMLAFAFPGIVAAS